jgi:hypothetical protein
MFLGESTLRQTLSCKLLLLKKESEREKEPNSYNKY